MSLPLREGDRVAVRDRPWRIQGVEEVAPGRHLLKLLPASGEGGSPLAVVSPPERISPLPPEELRFDPDELGPVGPWLAAHRALALAAIRDDALGGARYGRVKLEAYQVAPVLRILAKPRPRLLIADDVGLGKTIEAGLCILELSYRRRADRILVVVPPGLIPQWEEELLERFGLRFTVIENATGLAREQTRLPAGVSPWELPGARIITSVDYLKKPEVRRRALAKAWDLVIVDEAHALTESGSPRSPYRTRRTRLGEDLRERSRGLLLLTATPHNGYPHSFRSLVELVEPTAATLTGNNVRDRIERAMVRRMKRQIHRREDGEWKPAFLPRTVQPIPVRAEGDAARLFELIGRYCSRAVRDAEAAGEEDAELVSFAMQIVKKRAASSRLALERTLEHRLEALKKDSAREEPPHRAEIRDLQADLPMSDKQAERLARRILRSAIPKDEKRRRAETRRITEIQRLLERLGGPDYPRATTRRSIAAEEPADVLEYLTPLHPLVRAIAADARQRFLHVYPGERGLPPKRLAARRVPGDHPPAVLFTFHGVVAGPEGVIEELVLPVRIDLDGRVVGDPEADADLLRDGAAPGEVPREALEPFRPRFDELLRAASDEATRRLVAPAGHIRARRAALAEELRRDAAAYTEDRLRELEEEEARARGQLEDTGKVRLWAGEDPKRYSVKARREAVEFHYRSRIGEIEAYETVHDPAAPRPIAALFLVPEEPR